MQSGFAERLIGIMSQFEIRMSGSSFRRLECLILPTNMADGHRH